MAAATDQADAGLMAQAASSASEFVRDRLEESEIPLSPAELAEEYDCTSGHMRDVCSELTRDGVIERVAEGEYAVPGEDTEGSDDGGSDVILSDPPEASADADASEQMATQEEYRRQHTDSDGASAEGSDDAEQTGDDETAAGSEEGDELEEAPAPVLPMEPKKLGMVLAAALVLWLIYDNLYGGVDTEVETSDLDEEQDGGDDDGGLVGGLSG
jgi:hypothetical protein